MSAYEMASKQHRSRADALLEEMNANDGRAPVDLDETPSDPGRVWPKVEGLNDIFEGENV